ncbi:MAG: TauD/TfdA family dioxygenase [Alphaproteobacteria bacterium]|nr:TauD/TfdA family dioxygenase [Alphaproteobacteria bacterium]
MGQILTETVHHPSAWYGRDLARDDSWIVQLDPRHLEEIATAIADVGRRGLPFAKLTRDDFPLPTLGPKLRQWQKEIIDGRGFYLLRGLNAADYTDAEVGTIFWAIGLYLGHAVTQNPMGDLLGHVYDHGRRYGDLDVRGYETNAHLPFHTDSGDVVGLLCLRRSKSGGLSSVVSAVTIHNEILRRHPEYLAPLYRGFHYIRREAALTESPVTPHRLPVFGARDGHISVRLIRNQINAACTKTGVPLEPIEREALDFFDQLAQDPAIHLDMDLQVGDIQFCNNYAILHSRTGFEDHPEAERRRHMIRLWLTMDQRRPLSDDFPPHNGYGDRQLVETAMQAAG